MTANVADLARQLSANEQKVLAVLDKSGQALTPTEGATRAGVSETEFFSAASWLRTKGIIEIRETVSREVRLGPDGEKYRANGFPEQAAYEFVRSRPDHRATLTEVSTHVGPDAVKIALAWWKRKQLGNLERGADTILTTDEHARPDHDRDLLNAVHEDGAHGRRVDEEELKRRFPVSYERLRGRPGVLEIRDVKERLLVPTTTTSAVARQLGAQGDLVGEITPEMLQSGAWKGKEFQSYSLATAGQTPTPAKPHPLVQIIERVREIFVELGFTEIEGDFVQSAFWNLDALFIPQDHPAREMQDTFYLENPKSLPVPEDLFKVVSDVHKTGRGTGGRGWGRGLDLDESRRALLRTHTTVQTVKHLAGRPEPPVRVFSVGRVFRHETMDATHLPEFHQIEGIATEPGADFPMLLGLLQEFFRRLGFPQLRWRPAFFPYTEPSMEVEVWTGTKWMELGGCGIFRPEVTRPLGITTPVLAWGLGLERLAMHRLGLKDIRELYVSDLDWLRTQPLL